VGVIGGLLEGESLGEKLEGESLGEKFGELLTRVMGVVKGGKTLKVLMWEWDEWVTEGSLAPRGNDQAGEVEGNAGEDEEDVERDGDDEGEDVEIGEVGGGSSWILYGEGVGGRMLERVL
jgi:hypothetical protein